ncbi:hypothetical protein [Nostoc sp. 106C]|uniref:hypothetical protein n=1 Tax=Nostoc sp. 106C TaxID=1932667 RepID=UPI000A37B370|nr:hypothetical protein [Nostoc sp. 106C]OUL19323.1 hypothetical protein BV375_32385 [Nostoc sp. 106C]
MHQSCQNLIALLLASTSAFILTPCQAQSQPESNNSNGQNISPISSELATGIDKIVPSQPSDLKSSTNNKADILSENSNTSSTTATVSTTAKTSNLRVPISSRIFAVPSMQQ